MKQVKGTNMKAMSFGDSKARVILPSNKDKRITFKDVAGNREAKKNSKKWSSF